MNTEYAAEDGRLWIEEAQARLAHAEQHVPNRDGRIYCEQAHYAAEMAVKGLIVTNEHEFTHTHDIGVLLKEAQESGETIPAEVQKAKRLTPYGGTGRYKFERDKKRTAVGNDETRKAIDSARTTVTWASERIQKILSQPDKKRIDVEKGQNQDTAQPQPKPAIPKLAKPGSMKESREIPERPSAKHRRTANTGNRPPKTNEDHKKPPTNRRNTRSKR